MTSFKNFICYLFAFLRTGPSLPCEGFLELRRASFSLWGLLLLQSTGSRAHGLQSLRCTGLVAPQHVKSSRKWRKWKSLSCVQLFVDSPVQNTIVGSHSLLQGIFPTQGSSPGLLNCRWILYQLSHKGSPRILEWVAYHFSSRSSRPRKRTGVSCIAGGFFTNWAKSMCLALAGRLNHWTTREVPFTNTLSATSWETLNPAKLFLDPWLKEACIIWDSKCLLL